MVVFSGEPYNLLLSNNEGINIIMNKVTAENVIPMHLFSISAYERNKWSNLQTSRQIRNTPSKFCAFCVGNGRIGTRNNFMINLSNTYKKVDSCGGFMNNIGYTAPQGDIPYWNFLSQYKFNICFENTKQENYITEKLFNAYMGGSIPIYWGTSQVLEWFNPKAFLYLENDTPEDVEKLFEQIKILDNDNELYMKMLNEPLLIGEIPHDMNIDVWKNKINTCVSKTRQDLFI